MTKTIRIATVIREALDELDTEEQEAGDKDAIAEAEAAQAEELERIQWDGSDEPCEPGCEPVREHAGYTDGIEYYRTDTGWYWRACFPGCLPDGDPWGPFDVLSDAQADSMEGREPETAGTVHFI